MAYLRLRYSDGGIPRFAFMCFVQHIINGQLLITKPGIISFPMMSGSTCGVRGIRIAVRYIGFISMFYGCYSSETMKSIPICIPIISVKIDVVHRREYCVFCG